jgi:hypothetical protein
MVEYQQEHVDIWSAYESESVYRSCESAKRGSELFAEAVKVPVLKRL